MNNITCVKLQLNVLSALLKYPMKQSTPFIMALFKFKEMCTRSCTVLGQCTEEECSNTKMELVHSRTFLVCNVMSVSPFTTILGICKRKMPRGGYRKLVEQ